MKAKSLRLVAVMGLAGCLLGGASAEVVDRIVATVNHQIILQSDWVEAVACEALLGGRAWSSISEADRQASLQRLIDRALLSEQVQPETLAPATDAVKARVAEARAHFSAAATEAGWQSVLASYGVTIVELESYIATEIALMDKVDTRLLPNVQVDSRSIASYYRETFLPRLKQHGGKEVPLAQVSAQIKELLTQQRIGELLADWLAELRTEAKVTIKGSPQEEPAR